MREKPHPASRFRPPRPAAELYPTARENTEPPSSPRTPCRAWTATRSTLRALARDPRHWQIAVLGSLVVYGRTVLGLQISLPTVLATYGTALGIQALCTAWLGLPRFDPRSPLITGTSLTLLLRTGDPFVAAVAAGLAIASKFVVRVRGKHVFNPANLGLVAALLLFDDAWIAPGQWGTAAWMALFLVGAGQLVIHRAERSDITWALLASWVAVVFGRAAWLGDPWAIPVHQVSSGAFLIFAFFMISDPKTTPDRRSTRIVQALLVAAVAGFFEFALYKPAGLIWALVLCAPLVPLFDSLWPARAYSWPAAKTTATMADDATTSPSRPDLSSPIGAPT